MSFRSFQALKLPFRIFCLSKASEIIQKCSKNRPHTGHRGLDELPDGSTSTRRPGGLLCPGTSPPEVRVSTKAGTTPYRGGDLGQEWVYRG